MTTYSYVRCQFANERSGKAASRMCKLTSLLGSPGPVSYLIDS